MGSFYRVGDDGMKRHWFTWRGGVNKMAFGVIFSWGVALIEIAGESFWRRIACFVTILLGPRAFVLRPHWDNDRAL